MDAHERLQEARRKAGYATATDAAKAFGWSEVTYRAHENGTRGLKPGVAQRYARAFKVRASWLLIGDDAAQEAEYHRLFSQLEPGQKETAIRLLRALLDSEGSK